MGILDGLLGGGMQRGRGMSPLTLALLGVLGYQALKGKNLGDMFRGNAAPGQSPDKGGGLGDLLGGGLGSLLGGGAAGGILSGGLGDLLKQFQSTGHGDVAQSWVSSGPNKTISPQELEESLGPERVRWLMEQTGMSKGELLAGLSRELPEAVDELTPQGRIPTDQEAARLVEAR
jgi:uncharacterized protein YidB (DUF937 family)